MPPHVDKVETKKVACKNAADFPHDQAPPRWHLVRRRGVHLGYVWHRWVTREWVMAAEVDRPAIATAGAMHVTLPDLTEIGVVEESVPWGGGTPEAVAMLVNYWDEKITG